MRDLRLLLCAFAALAALSAPASAHDAWGGGIEVMDDAEMSALRGGIAIAPGLDVNFGATITTFVGGAPALTTQLTWTDQGRFVEQTAGAIGRRVDSLSSGTRSAMGLAGLENLGGVVIDDAQGATTLVHNIADGALQNIILNTASGRDLRQEIDVTLEIPGFEALSEAIAQGRLGMRISDDMRGAAF